MRGADEGIKARVNAMIAKALQEAEDGGVWELGGQMSKEDTAEADQLSQQYLSLLQTQLQELTQSQDNVSEEWSFALGDFSRALLGAPDVRREVEPLVAFLVIFAKSQHLGD